MGKVDFGTMRRPMSSDEDLRKFPAFSPDHPAGTWGENAEKPCDLAW
jgi:hypothetical protein